MSMRNHSAISKSSPRSCRRTRVPDRPPASASDPETTVANGESRPRTSTFSGVDAELLVCLAQRGRNHVGVGRLGAAAGERDLARVRAKIRRSGARRAAARRAVDGSQSSSTDAGRPPSAARRQQRRMRAATIARSRSTIGASMSSAARTTLVRRGRTLASMSADTAAEAKPRRRCAQMRRRAAFLASRVRGQGNVRRGAALQRRAATSFATQRARRRRPRSATRRSVIATSTPVLSRTRCSTRDRGTTPGIHARLRAELNRPAVAARAVARSGAKRSNHCRMSALTAVAIDVDGDRMTAARQHLQLHRLAADEAPRDLASHIADRWSGRARRAGPSTGARISASSLRTTAQRRRSSSMLRVGRDAVAVQLLDGAGMPEIDVVTGVMPADHALDHRQQRRQRPAQPDRRGEAWRRHGRDGRAPRGGARACHPSTGRRPRRPSTRVASSSNASLHICRPVLPASPLELLWRRAVARKRRRVAAEAVLRRAPRRDGAAPAACRRTRG